MYRNCQSQQKNLRVDFGSPIGISTGHPLPLSPHPAFQGQDAPSRTISDLVENLGECVEIRDKRPACLACEINNENLRVLLLEPFGEPRDNRTSVCILATPYHIPYRHHLERDVAQRTPPPVSPPNRGWSTQMQTRQTLTSALSQKQSQRPEVS